MKFSIDALNKKIARFARTNTSNFSYMDLTLLLGEGEMKDLELLTRNAEKVEDSSARKLIREVLGIEIIETKEPARFDLCKIL